jgi:hypothetical protein
MIGVKVRLILIWGLFMVGLGLESVPPNKSSTLRKFLDIVHSLLTGCSDLLKIRQELLRGRVSDETVLHNVLEQFSTPTGFFGRSNIPFGHTQ